MSSAVAICSDALRQLGDDPITSLTDDSTRARLCNAFYEPMRDAVLRAYPWNFAITRQVLAQLVTTPAYGFSFEYQLPTDPYCLRVLNVDDTGLAFKIEGRKLLTDASSVSIKYIARITDEAQFDVLFIDALSVRLASRLAYPVTGSASLTDVFFAKYKDVLSEARSIDAQEGTPEIFESNALTEVR